MDKESLIKFANTFYMYKNQNPDLSDNCIYELCAKDKELKVMNISSTLISSQEIIDICFDVSSPMLVNYKHKTRKREFVFPRYLSFYFLKEIKKELSLSQLGYFFNKDHSTVLHGIKTIKNLLTYDKEVRMWSEKIEEKIIKLIWERNGGNNNSGAIQRNDSKEKTFWEEIKEEHKMYWGENKTTSNSKTKSILF